VAWLPRRVLAKGANRLLVRAMQEKKRGGTTVARFLQSRPSSNLVKPRPAPRPVAART
jgi:hypothetical protein